MSGTKYFGQHRVLEETAADHQVAESKWRRRILVLLSTIVAIVFGVSSTAFASPVHVVSGDTFSGLVAKHCKTSNWQAVAFAGRNKNLIYAGETIDITCPGAAPAAVKKTAPPAPKPVVKKTTTGWFNPLPGHRSLCNYWQWRGSYYHRGEDIPAGRGTPIHAIHSGNVQTKWDGGGGNMTIITHDGMAEVYMHQSSYRVRSGWVNGGDIIGYIGDTGDPKPGAYHLHLEIQPKGPWKGVTSPDKWLAARGIYIGC